jgi:hypothetical protein
MFNWFKEKRREYVFKKYVLPSLEQNILATLSWRDIVILKEAFSPTDISGLVESRYVTNLVRIFKTQILLAIYTMHGDKPENVYTILLPRKLAPSNDDRLEKKYASTLDPEKQAKYKAEMEWIHKTRATEIEEKMMAKERYVRNKVFEIFKEHGIHGEHIDIEDFVRDMDAVLSEKEKEDE